MTERVEKWTPIEGIDHDFLTAEVWFDFPQLAVRLNKGIGDTDTGVRRDLILLFEHVAAVFVHEEFVHPTQTTWGKEQILTKDLRATFPCLLVRESAWFADLKQELEINYPGAEHYRLCTGFPVVDVITDRPPRVAWRERPAAQDSVPPEWAKLG